MDIDTAAGIAVISKEMHKPEFANIKLRTEVILKNYSQGEMNM